jgi:NAD(P)-dependent dehydrogenase (short-subunit alcohol dehydrogenase family)
MDNVLGYAGKRVIVSGAASGMGAATTALLVELGAEVHAVDIKKPDLSGLASFTETDLREPAEIDAAVRRIGKVVDGLFNCAGLPNTFSNLDVMLVNFCGLRHLTEAVIPNMVEGGAIASIASSAGIGWLTNMAVLGELLATPDFASARTWCEEHPKEIANGYGVSKEAINAYTAVRSFTLAPLGIRINCLNPGPTDTPMMPHFEEAVGKEFMASFPKPLWGRNARPEEQAWPLLFLNSPRASFVTGVQFDADAGFRAGLFTGQIDPAAIIPDTMRT